MLSRSSGDSGLMPFSRLDLMMLIDDLCFTTLTWLGGRYKLILQADR